MKKIGTTILLLTAVCLSGCTPNEKETYDYSLYRSYVGNMKGIEVYCWEKDENWYSGLLPGTNRVKRYEEIVWLQDNLPCPLKTMKQILLDYPKSDIGRIIVVDVPPTGWNGRINDSNYESYVYVCEQLGIDFPYGQIY